MQTEKGGTVNLLSILAPRFPLVLLWMISVFYKTFLTQNAGRRPGAALGFCFNSYHSEIQISALIVVRGNQDTEGSRGPCSVGRDVVRTS